MDRAAVLLSAPYTLLVCTYADEGRSKEEERPAPKGLEGEAKCRCCKFAPVATTSWNKRETVSKRCFVSCPMASRACFVEALSIFAEVIPLSSRSNFPDRV